MDLLSRTSIEKLAGVECDHCVSMFIPTHRGGMETKNEHDAIKLKNQLKEAKRELVKYGMKEKEADEYLEPVEKLVKDTDFWTHQSDGLAIFRSPGFFKYYTLPVNFDDFHFVSRNFYLKPLLSLFSENARFFLMTLSHNTVKLYEATEHSIREVIIEDLVPLSMQESYFYAELKEDHLQHHSGQGPHGRAMYHGQGEEKDKRKLHLEKFFHEVNNGLQKKVLNAEKIPLMLAGVEYLLPIYREANTYDYLVDEELHGNFEMEDITTLRKKAWEAIEPLYSRKKEEQIYRFQEMIGTGMASENIEEVVPSAVTGRVDTLFVASGVHKWGRYDESTNSISQKDNFEYGDNCLLNMAATKTFIQSGNVYINDPVQLTGNNDTVMAAIFRY